MCQSVQAQTHKHPHHRQPDAMTERILPPLTEAEREHFIAAARGYMHVRWRHQGRSMKGVDCAGLVIVALQEIGKTPQDAVGYGRVPYRGKLEETLRVNMGDPIADKRDMRPGDTALMRFKGAPSHVGIITPYPFGGCALLHAFAQDKRVTEARLDDLWMSYIVEVYRT